jgi:predicted SAM-dependent methyltransferase
MSNKKINLACGAVYLKEWTNFDYAPHSDYVLKANLLGKLPIKSETASVVYSSHFIEHIPRKYIQGFINECFRITESGGSIRLVLPDWEEMCNTYINLRNGKEKLNQKKADYMIIEMLDQCVRQNKGGDLGLVFNEIKKVDGHDLKNFIEERTGQVFSSRSISTKKLTSKYLFRSLNYFWIKLEEIYSRVIVMLLPRAFRQLNVSFTSIGEKHMWMYDFHTLSKVLMDAGYIEIKKKTADTSDISEFPLQVLDLMENGKPYKGSQSMYVEAWKN